MHAVTMFTFKAIFQISGSLVPITEDFSNVNIQLKAATVASYFYFNGWAIILHTDDPISQGFTYAIAMNNT